MASYYNKVAVDEIMDKEQALQRFMINMLNKTNNIFCYTGLPDSLPARFLELYIQTGGHGFVTDVNDELLVFQGGLGGEPDKYYQPTIYTVANPALNFSKCLKIGEEGVLCRNDSMMLGLKPLLLKYGTLIIENLISFRVAAINTRIQTIIDAADDAAAASAEEYIKKIEEGKLSVISSDDMFSKIHVNPASSHDRCIIDLIELNQYLLSQLYSELGVAENYNMKRERLTDEEAKMVMNKPNISLENMLTERCMFCDEINKKYGTNIKVTKNERWEESANIKGSLAEFGQRDISKHSASGSDSRMAVRDSSGVDGSIIDRILREQDSQ